MSKSFRNTCIRATTSMSETTENAPIGCRLRGRSDEKGDCDGDSDSGRRIGVLRPQRPQQSQPRRRVVEGSGEDPAAVAAATVVAAAATAAASTAAEAPETPASVALAAASALRTGDADTIISKRGRRGREFEASRLLLTD